jgi:hypothetical protein
VQQLFSGALGFSSVSSRHRQLCVRGRLVCAATGDNSLPVSGGILG